MGDNQFARQWRKKRRTEYRNTRGEQFYIFCEGEKTEPNYFRAFKELIESDAAYKNMVLIEIEGCGADTLRVLDHAKQYIAEQGISRGQVWCVYDKDDFKAQDFDGVLTEMQKLNKNDKNVRFYAAWSNQCIEFWFLLHFCNYTSDNHRKQYIEALNRHFSKFGKKYLKNDKENFNYLLRHGDPKLAIKFAKKIIDDNADKLPSKTAPATKVYSLVEELAKYLPEEIRNKFV